ncbi:MAG TPA: hypothetical protein VFK07_02845 [Candidatus Paceibacterota bacterium]|nr:hypothetical protein [Candidatus Paceibacterota bacterium]
MPEFDEVDEGSIQAELETRRMLERQAETSAPSKPVKRMGWVIFLLGLILIIVQTFVDWLGVGIVGFLIGGPISLILWLMVRPYRKSLGSLYWLLNSSFIIDAIPFLDIIPVDFVFWIAAFFVSRKIDKN